MKMSSSRVRFSSDFFDEKNFITISPMPPQMGMREEKVNELARGRNGEFEFLSGNSSSARHMLTADVLFSGGKLLPSWQKQQSEKLSEIRLRAKDDAATDKEEEEALAEEVSKGERRASWYVDDDPSPRPPKCTVLWKELLRLKKQPRPASAASSSSSLWSPGNKMVSIDEEKEMGGGKKEKQSKRVKKGLERTRSSSTRIRPMVNVPAACTQGRGSSSGLPPLFYMKKVREVRR